MRSKRHSETQLTSRIWFRPLIQPITINFGASKKLSTHFLRAAKVLLNERAMRGQTHASQSGTGRFATRLGRGVSERPLHPTGEARKTKIAFSNNHILSFSGLPLTDSGYQSGLATRRSQLQPSLEFYERQPLVLIKTLLST
jgi:hypothetical protein